MSLPVLNEVSNYPVPVSDRFGDWMDDYTLSEHWGASDPFHVARLALAGLKGVYGDDERDGDPRVHLHQEVCFVSVHRGLIGIHTEIELEDEFNDLDDPSEFEAELTKDEFDDYVTLYAEKLEPLIARYPESEFFISHGEACTYKGRVTVNAFTPLKRPAGMDSLQSPYFGDTNSTGSCEVIKKLTDDLINLVFEIDEAAA